MSFESIEDLLHKYLQGLCTKEEEAYVDEWYKKLHFDSETTFEDQIQDSAYKALKYKEFQQRIGSENLNSNYQIKNRSQQGKLYKFLIAASLILVLLGATMYYFFNKKVDTEIIVTNSHTIRKVKLPDGTLVWLKHNSSIEYPDVFVGKIREVKMKGEALFEVAKDKKHPFVIQSGNFLTTVLGTSFNLKEDNKTNAYSLVVLTGKVMVTQLKNKNLNHIVEKDNDTLFVIPGQKVDSIVTLKHSILKNVKDYEYEKVTYGTQYDMNFHSTPFAEIIDKIEKKFDIKIQVDLTLYKTCEISADITDQSLDKSLQIICAVTDAHYSIDNNIIKITDGGCK